MTPDRPFALDDRWDIACLVQRAPIVLPEVILPDGTASPSQVAIVPPGVSLDRALLPHREVGGMPASWTGAALVGTREPELLPYVDGFAAAPSADGPLRHITRPQSSTDILAWLYDLTGYRYAPAAFWKVAGWEIGWAAHWLHRLYTGGATGALIVAERQAAAAAPRPPLANVLDTSVAEIEALATSTGPHRASATAWCDLAIGDLTRLEQADPAVRLAALADVRTDLVYKLIITRRLDRLLEALPWMMAPSGAFPLTFGGPPGAIAALFEVGRAREIALELKLRVILGPSGQRLDTRQGRRDYGSDVAVRRGLAKGDAGLCRARSADRLRSDRHGRLRQAPRLRTRSLHLCRTA